MDALQEVLNKIGDKVEADPAPNTKVANDHVDDRTDGGEPATDPVPVIDNSEVEALKIQISNLQGTVQNLTQVATNRNNPEPATVAEPEFEVELDPEVAKVIDYKIAKAVKEAKNSATKQMSEAALTERMDKKAESDFPWLFKTEHPEFTAQHSEILKEEYQKLTNRKSSDAVYNAAARAQARIALSERNNKDSEKLRNLTIAEGKTQGAGGRVGSGDKGSQLSDEQKYMAYKLGVSEKDYISAREAKNSGKRRRK